MEADPPLEGGFAVSVELVFAKAEGISSPVVYRGGNGGSEVVFATGEPRLYATNEEGKEAWSADLAGAAGGGLTSDPKNGAVYVGGNDGKLYAFGEGGEASWAYDAGAPVLATVVVEREDEESLVALAAGDGTVRW